MSSPLNKDLQCPECGQFGIWDNRASPHTERCKPNCHTKHKLWRCANKECNDGSGYSWGTPDASYFEAASKTPPTPPVPPSPVSPPPVNPLSTDDRIMYAVMIKAATEIHVPMIYNTVQDAEARADSILHMAEYLFVNRLQ